MGNGVYEKTAALSWLSRAYWNVPDKEMLEGFDGSCFGFAGEKAKDAVDLIAQAVDLLSDDLLSMKVDFTSLFCSCKADAPFPYESVYRSEKRLLMQPIRDEVVDLYEAGGFVVRQEGGNEPEDHLSFELAAFARFIGEAYRCGQEGDFQDQAKYSDLASRLLTDHLRAWVGSFCDEVENAAQTPLYRGVATLTRAVVDAL